MLKNVQTTCTIALISHASKVMPKIFQARLQLGFPGGSAGKEFACNAGDLGLIPGLRRSLVEGKGYYIVREVPKSWSQLSNFHFQHNSATLSLVHLFGMTVNSYLHAPNLQNFWTSQSKYTILNPDSIHDFS